MLFSSLTLLSLALVALAEVPQEHSHEPILQLCNQGLKLDNPDNIGDCVFGLLGNAAAAQGQGQIANPDCLQQASADRAFTNAKAAGDVDLMVGALSYRAVERNTGKVGLASVICDETPVNPEIAAISQHQDPASANAAAVNKAIVLELAKQIAAVGGNPQDALATGTFPPGDVNDNTGKGNSCDDITANGCIVDQGLLVEDATADEIDAAVAGGGGGGGGQANANAGKGQANANAGKGQANANANAGGNAAAGAAVGKNTARCSAAGLAAKQAAAAAAAPPAAQEIEKVDKTAAPPAPKAQKAQHAQKAQPAHKSQRVQNVQKVQKMQHVRAASHAKQAHEAKKAVAHDVCKA